jgi:hypothetical protein
LAATRLGELAGPAVAVATRGLSRARGKRIAHPHGVGFQGLLTPLEGGLAGTALAAESAAIVRLSRAFGLPEPLPDLLGLALRIPDAYGPGLHQDVLMASCGSSPLGRWIFLPARGFAERPYTTLLPYRLNEERIVFEAAAPAAKPPGPSLRDLHPGGATPPLFELRARGPVGDGRPIARLSLRARLDDSETERLAFDPTNTGGGLELAGLLNGLRGPGYRGSQEGRGAPPGAQIW